MTSAVVSMACATGLIVWHETLTKVMGEEAYKALLQFFLVAVLGGGVSLVYQAFNREADWRTELLRRQEERADILREIRQRYLRELIAQYNTVKRARRLLRALALEDGPDFLDRRVRIDRYDDLLQPVLDAQLALETMTRTMGAEGGLFEADRELISSLDRASSYLRSLITEYESTMPRVGGPEIVLRTMPELADLIGAYAESNRFRYDFVHSVHSVMAALERLVTTPTRAPE
ncbi:hypothetical protein OHB35_15705 [Streptomyces phaeochromogenes]|uniref:Uncharacterized protein n=1 Tax=Streptomyces phaeochromogenes TaxID=1923 RepID=A0ABZ1HBQ5_STRPH|nr:hypothetical protein [Streptomyces phaeochromogenes]WSD14573.1 hypothetical protein OHB35_15705 [Streptomyces phaeochromogenes]